MVCPIPQGDHNNETQTTLTILDNTVLDNELHAVNTLIKRPTSQVAAILIHVTHVQQC